MSVSDKFIDYLYELTQVELSESAVLQAKKCLLDYLGVTFAGSVMLKEKGKNFLDNAETGNIPVIGFNRKSSLYNAALINGMSAHIAELDDGVRQGSIHPGAAIISALLPVAQKYNITGLDFLKGMIVGYEAAIRLASAIQPSHRNKGYHATGTCGTIGVALGLGAALGFSKQQMKNALSAAATSSSGMLNVIKGGSELKPYNAGHAAISGIIAAVIAQAGFSGPADVLAGEWGFLDVMAEKSNLSLLERNPGEKLGIEKVYMKPYAACRHSHPAIEAALVLKQNNGIDPEQISEVVVATYNLAAKGHEHTEISGITDAKMSTPYSVAVALITGKAGINQYTEEMINNKQILELAKKVKVIADDALNAYVPEKRPAELSITTYNNETIAYRVDLAKGEPETPLTVEEINEKIISLSLFGGKTVEYTNQLANAIWNIETDISSILINL